VGARRRPRPTDLRTIQTLDGLEAAGVSVVRASSSNRAGAWNTGLAATVAPLVVFPGPADLLRPGFLTEAASCVGGPPAWAWFAAVPPDGVTATTRPLRSGPSPIRSGSEEAAVRREAAWDVGWLRHRAGSGGLEHFDLGLALVASGWEITTLDVIGFDCRTRDTGGSAVGTPLGLFIGKHRGLVVASSVVSAELLAAAQAVVAVANDQRDRAVATLVDARERLTDLGRRSQVDLTASEARVVAADTRIAAMGRQARTLEERIAEVTDEVARREQAAEAARARASSEDGLRPTAVGEAEECRQESRPGRRRFRQWSPSCGAWGAGGREERWIPELVHRVGGEIKLLPDPVPKKLSGQFVDRDLIGPWRVGQTTVVGLTRS